jgi:hypothetical protein
VSVEKQALENGTRRSWTIGGSGSGDMRAVGRAGQWLGLVLPGIAILLELNRRISLGQMLVMLVAAVCCFGIGRILEGYAGS